MMAGTGASADAGAGAGLTSPSLSELTTDEESDSGIFAAANLRLLPLLASGVFGALDPWENLHLSPFLHPAGDAKKAQGFGPLSSVDAAE